MIPIQVLLISLLGILLLLILRKGPRWRGRVLQLALIVVGVALVAKPEWSTVLANSLGIGRGADLVLYLAVTAAGYAWVIQNQRLRELEAQLTVLTRALAKVTAKSDERSEGD